MDSSSNSSEVNLKQDRREAMKSGLGVLFASSFPNLSLVEDREALSKTTSPPEILRHQQRVIQIAMSHTAEETSRELDRKAVDGFLPRFFADEKRGFILSSAFNDLLDIDNRISFMGQTIGQGSRTIHTQLPRVLDAKYNSCSGSVLVPVSEDSRIDMKATVENTRTSVEVQGENVLTVGKNEEKSAILPPVKVETTIYEDREIENSRDQGDEVLTRKVISQKEETEVTPQLKIRDLGILPVLKPSAGMILPESMVGSNLIRGKADRVTSLRAKTTPGGIVKVWEVEA